jgi:RNA polymerase sigma factor (sigma-70 family)
MTEDDGAGFTGQADTTMHHGLLVIDLVTRARTGDKRSWDALVERYAPLIWSICRRYRLDRADAEDVGQSVWLRLVDQLDKIRDPAALPGWLATTTRRECERVLRAARGPHAAVCALDAENLPAEQAGTAEQELLRAERHTALREAFTHLPPDGQRLIALLIADPPLPYTEISTRLGIPVGSIGPNRSRCLAKMRRYPAIAALINSEEEQQRTVNHLRPLDRCLRRAAGLPPSGVRVVRIMLFNWDPPIGIEPMADALREACSRAAHALAAPTAPVIALMTPAALGLSGDSVHEPVHGPRPKARPRAACYMTGPPRRRAARTSGNGGEARLSCPAPG